MNRTLLVLLASVMLAGCSPSSWPVVSQAPSPRESSADPSSPFVGLERVQPAPPTPLPDRSRAKPSAADPLDSTRKPKPFLIENTFFPSGWMGDAAATGGPLRYGVSRDNPHSSPTCEKWVYEPTSHEGEQGWIAVAYQGPTENNWGDVTGIDLSQRRYRAVTFMARGLHGGERLQIRSGGCTRPGAPYPASHDISGGVIVLSPNWDRYEIPLNGCCLSNVCSVFSFTITRSLAPDGCTFYLDDIALE